jgi:hypothetical protein
MYQTRSCNVLRGRRSQVQQDSWNRVALKESGFVTEYLDLEISSTYKELQGTKTSENT